MSRHRSRPRNRNADLPRVGGASQLVAHAERLLSNALRFDMPVDAVVSRYFREHRELGQPDRAFLAETVYAILRRRRTLESLASSTHARPLVIAALMRVHGWSLRAIEPLLKPGEQEWATGMRALDATALPAAVRAELPDWLWTQLCAEQGEDEARLIAQSLLETAPLDIRVNLARISRSDARARLAQSGIEAHDTPYSPAGLRLSGKPAVNRESLFEQGLIEVQDEGSQLLAYLLAPRRGEMIADFCAGAGGKTLALAMLMRGTGRLYAFDVSAKRLAALGPRAIRAQVSSIHPVVLDDERDLRARRLTGKIDRVLVDAPCTGFGTLRRNPDLKWRQGPEAVDQLAAKQQRILAAAARLVAPGGRLVYATCSILRAEDEAIADWFLASSPEFAELSCADILAGQRVALDTGPRLRLWTHRHRTDGFFAATFERRG